MLLFPPWLIGVATYWHRPHLRNGPELLLFVVSGALGLLYLYSDVSVTIWHLMTEA